MPKAYQKYLIKLPKKWKEKLNKVIDRIKILDLENIDCKKMTGFKNIFRVRVGKFRIIFEKKDGFGDILEIQTRGDVY